MTLYFANKSINRATVKPALQVLSLFLILLILNGCATVTPSLKANHKPVGEEAYIYGDLKMLQELPISYIAIVITGDNNEQYFLPLALRSAQEKRIIAVKPGHYRISEIQFRAGGGEIQGAQPFDSKVKMNQAFTLSANQAIYIGDYIGDSYFTNNNSTARKIHWVLAPPQNNFDETTAYFNLNYDFFNSLERKSIFTP